MPKDNEVDEKVIQRYAPNIVCDGSIDMEPSEFGTWISLSDHSATVAELRAEVAEKKALAEDWKSLHDSVSVAYVVQARALTRSNIRADAAERRVGKLEVALKSVLDANDDADPPQWKGSPVQIECLKALTGADPT